MKEIDSTWTAASSVLLPLSNKYWAGDSGSTALDHILRASIKLVPHTEHPFKRLYLKRRIPQGAYLKSWTPLLCEHAFKFQSIQAQI